MSESINLKRTVPRGQSFVIQVHALDGLKQYVLSLASWSSGRPVFTGDPGSARGFKTPDEAAQAWHGDTFGRSARKSFSARIIDRADAIAGKSAWEPGTVIWPVSGPLRGPFTLTDGTADGPDTIMAAVSFDIPEPVFPEIRHDSGEPAAPVVDGLREAYALQTILEIRSRHGFRPWAGENAPTYVASWVRDRVEVTCNPDGARGYENRAEALKAWLNAGHSTDFLLRASIGPIVRREAAAGYINPPSLWHNMGGPVGYAVHRSAEGNAAAGLDLAENMQVQRIQQEREFGRLRDAALSTALKIRVALKRFPEHPGRHAWADLADSLYRAARVYDIEQGRIASEEIE